jgi:hypothetical protein
MSAAAFCRNKVTESGRVRGPGRPPMWSGMTPAPAVLLEENTATKYPKKSGFYIKADTLTGIIVSHQYYTAT